jgi:hypothetical protein
MRFKQRPEKAVSRIEKSLRKFMFISLSLRVNALDKPVKCWTCMSPCLQGLFLGILMNGITLATVLVLWFVPRHGTGVIITDGKYFTFQATPLSK